MGKFVRGPPPRKKILDTPLYKSLIKMADRNFNQTKPNKAWLPGPTWLWSVSFSLDQNTLEIEFEK